MVIPKANLVTDNGSMSIAATLHAVAVLLKQAKRWDWFINLGSSEYPLMPQDDILHIFSYLPRDLNFLEHTSDTGPRETIHASFFQVIHRIFVDGSYKIISRVLYFGVG
ncbi:unnamed protein product [Fraxinus pennsylvanica]|uniref:Uncharacterized protein n=1 Tax=Fraxinus pennsylvanica TaxID=56036 RepID=A0AAD2A803_9LAMI|nr:unnamed protein product [Fraxinus pennsylvanica]